MKVAVSHKQKPYHGGEETHVFFSETKDNGSTIWRIEGRVKKEYNPVCVLNITLLKKTLDKDISGDEVTGMSPAVTTVNRNLTTIGLLIVKQVFFQPL